MNKKLNIYLFKKRAQKYLSATPRQHHFVSYEKAKTVLLLFGSDYSEKNPAVRKIIYTLQQDGKKVTAWGYADKKETTSVILPDFRILNHKQIDFFQKPLGLFIKELQESEFDLMIDLTLNVVLPQEYLAMYANVSFKTGVRKSDLPMYDFILDLDNVQPSTDSSENPIDEMYVFNQIIFYLKSIQTND